MYTFKELEKQGDPTREIEEKQRDEEKPNQLKHFRRRGRKEIQVRGE